MTHSTPAPRELRRFTVWPDGTVFGPSGEQLTPFPDKVQHGTALIGIRHHQAKITEDDVRLIRSMAGSSTEVAPLFGISPSMVRRIRGRKNWTHL